MKKVLELDGSEGLQKNVNGLNATDYMLKTAKMVNFMLRACNYSNIVNGEGE